MCSPRLTRLASYLLGAFVCIELVYLPLSNLIRRVPRRMAPLPDELITRFDREGQVTDFEPFECGFDVTGGACDRWGQLTAQGQGWSLFAPRFGENGTFLEPPRDGQRGSTTELRSRFEPADPDDYVRIDLTHHRLFNQEASFAILYALWTPDSFTTRGEDWRQAVREWVTTFRRSLSAYVHWRLREEHSASSARGHRRRSRLPAAQERLAAAGACHPLGEMGIHRPDELTPFDPVTGGFAVSAE